MKIALITDTLDNINGVVTTIKSTTKELKKRGHTVDIFDPSQCVGIPCPGYPEVTLSINAWSVGSWLHQKKADSIHIFTEGPLGFFARNYCARHQLNYTTSFHTKFPEYLNTFYGVPESWSWKYFRWFHQSSYRVLATSNDHKTELENHGLKNVIAWGRGVDTELFSPSRKNPQLYPTNKPNILCVSRLSKEKGLDQFCQLDYQKYNLHLVGDGPCRSELAQKYPYINFYGYKQGTDLAEHYASADCFAFPSVTDTFGVVMLESMASGTPVAALETKNIHSVIDTGVNGIVSTQLSEAIDNALKLDRNSVYQSSKKWSWAAATDIFEESLYGKTRLQL